MTGALLDFVAQHKGTLSVAGAWAIREAHIAWPFVRPSVSLPFLRANGGLWGILKTILHGGATPNTETKPTEKV